MFKQQITFTALLVFSLTSLFAQDKVKDYDTRYPFNHDFQIIQKKDRFGLIDENGGFVTPIKYTRIYYFNAEGLARVEINDSIGYINEVGKEVIPCKYEKIFEQFAALSRPRYDEIDSEVVEYIQAIYTPVKMYDLYMVQQMGKIFFIHAETGNRISSNAYNFAVGSLSYLPQTANDSKWLYYPKIQDGSSGIHNFYYTVFDHGIAAMVKTGMYPLDGKIGFINSDGRELTEFEYDGFVSIKRNGVPGFVNPDGNIIVIKNNKAGLINAAGKQIVPCMYDVVFDDPDYMRYFNGIAKVQSKGNIGFINTAGKEIISCKYEPLAEPAYNRFRNDYAIVKFGDFVRIIDRNGQNITNMDFDNLKFLFPGLALGRIENKGLFLIEIPRGVASNINDQSSLSSLAHPGYDDFITFTDPDYGLIRQSKRSYAVINKSLKIIAEIDLPPYYSFYKPDRSITPGFYDGMIAMQHNLNKEIVFLDVKGKKLFSLDGNYSCGMFGEGYALLFEDGKTGLISSKGHIIVKPKYENAYIEDAAKYGFDLNYSNLRMADRLIPVKRNGNYGYINHKGERVIGFKYDFAMPFNNHQAQVVYKGKIRTINAKGDYIAGKQHVLASEVPVLHPVLKYVKHKTGQIENYLSLRIEHDYYSIYLPGENIPLEYFSNCNRTNTIHTVYVYAGYKMQNLLGAFFIDNDGKMLDETIYENASLFSDNIALVKKDSNWFFIDEQFEPLFGQVYDSAQQFISGKARVKINGSWQSMDKSGKVLGPAYPVDVLDAEYLVDIVYYGNKKVPDPYLDKKYNSKRKSFIDRPMPIHPATLTEDLNLIGFKGMDTFYMQKGKMGYIYIRPNGMLAFPVYYSNAGKFVNNRAHVQNSYGKSGYIDHNGNDIIPLIYDWVGPIYFADHGKIRLRNYVIVKRNDTYGVYDADGREIAPLEFSRIYDEYNPEEAGLFSGMAQYQFILVEKNGTKYFINLQGKCIKNCP